MNSKNFLSRRGFINRSGHLMLGAMAVPWLMDQLMKDEFSKIRQYGPAYAYRPSLSVAFVRREEQYGMRWPGQIYDGESALQMYARMIRGTAGELAMDMNMRDKPIYSLEEAESWIEEEKSGNTDGLLVVLLDRQMHSWPSAYKAAESGIPTLIFSPLGSSFTTNTARLTDQKGVVVHSTDDFSEVAMGMKMIHAGAKLRQTRFLIISGDERKEAAINTVGTALRYIPETDFVEEYESLEVDRKTRALAGELITLAREVDGPTKQDVINGIKSYFVALNLLQREACDGISMDCLGALGPREISLPCIAWSRMNDHGVPAACEADLGACVTHALVQYLFDKPGFQQDPVAETSLSCLIGSHCSCPACLNGFGTVEEPYDIVHHHGKRDATIRPQWKVGQEITVADFVLRKGSNVVRDPRENDNPLMYISSGRVVDNKSVPPSGGCVVAPMVKLDGVDEMLDYPGFHQIIFYGNHKRDLKNFSQLYGIEPVVI